MTVAISISLLLTRLLAYSVGLYLWSFKYCLKFSRCSNLVAASRLNRRALALRRQVIQDCVEDHAHYVRFQLRGVVKKEGVVSKIFRALCAQHLPIQLSRNAPVQDARRAGLRIPHSANLLL